MISTYVASGGSDLSKPSPEQDDPIQELEYLEQCFTSKMEQILKELGPQVRWLGRNGIDVDLEGIVQRAKEDFQDDTGHHLVSRW